MRRIWLKRAQFNLNELGDYLGFLDIEGYRDSKGVFQAYCAAAIIRGTSFTAYFGGKFFYTLKRRKIEIKSPVVAVLLEIVEYMKVNKIKRQIVYVHNLASFDSYFVIKACLRYGIRVNILRRNSEVYFVKVRLGHFQIELRCSLLLLKQSLNDCAKSFGVSNRKMPFPHDWLSRDRLLYVGVPPEGFESLGPEFNVKDYAIKYCLNDCKVLAEVVTSFDLKVREFGVGLELKAYSIPGLALKAFKCNYIKEETIMDLQSKSYVDRFIREAYFGGRTEVYKAYVGNNEGYYYDVKGMYAQVMKQNLPCGRALHLTSFETSWLKPGMMPGFYRVMVDAPENNIMVLPRRGENGRLTFPFGKWTGTYYHEELLLAQEYGYDFKPIDAMVFEKTDNLFGAYVDDFTRIKEMGGAYRAIGKLFINSLYGRFAMQESEEVTVVINQEMEDFYSSRFDIIDRIEIGNYLILTHSRKPNLLRYKQHHSIEQYLADYKKYKYLFPHTEGNVALSAAITSLGRIKLFRDIQSVISAGGVPLYCDTDSIFAQYKESPLGQTHGGVFWDPNDPETSFEEGVFLGPKMYSIKNRHTHIKGIKVDKTDHNRFLDVLKTESPLFEVKGNTQFFRRDYAVLFREVDKTINLWDNSKRVWVKEDNELITKPLSVEDSGVALEGKAGADLLRRTIDSTFLDKYLPLAAPSESEVRKEEIEGITVYNRKRDLVIEFAVGQNLESVYFTILSKLVIQEPKFIRFLYKSKEMHLTLDKFIYHPYVYFPSSCWDFKDYLNRNIAKIEHKYEIKHSGRILIILVYPLNERLLVRNFRVRYPFPEDLIKDQRMIEVSKIKKKLQDIKDEEQNLLDQLSAILKENP